MLAALVLAAFVTGPHMSVPRVYHTATVLQDGRVLIVGGSTSDARCEIYDPATRTFRTVGSTFRPRYRPAATRLADGRVLVTGGIVVPDFRGLPFGTWGDGTAEIFDPRTETFTRVGNMSGPRYDHASTLLPDGRVLVSGGGYGYVGGFSVSLHPQRGTDIFDPKTNEFTIGPAMDTARWDHTATRLPDGKVLIAGLPTDYEAGISIESFDGVVMRPIWSGLTPTRGHSATLLPDGRVLYVTAPVVEVYDRGLEDVARTNVGREHAATLLADGRVLLTGGGNDVAEIFDPEENAIVPAGRMRRARYGHTATLLRDGTVLIAGGRTTSATQLSVFEATFRTELFDDAASNLRGRRRSSRK